MMKLKKNKKRRKTISATAIYNLIERMSGRKPVLNHHVAITARYLPMRLKLNAGFTSRVEQGITE